MKADSMSARGVAWAAYAMPVLLPRQSGLLGGRRKLDVIDCSGTMYPKLSAARAAKGIAMNEDPIVEELRDAGRKYFARFNGDLPAAFADLDRQIEELRRAGREVITLPPRPPQSQQEA